MSKENEDLLKADTNPSGLSVKGEPKAVKRLNKMPILIIGSVVLVFMFGLMYVVNQRAAKQQEIVAGEEPPVVDSGQAVQDILNNAPDGVIPDALAGPAEHPTPKVGAAQPATAPKLQEREPAAARQPQQSQQMTEYQREMIRIQRMQTEQYMAALSEDSEIKGWSAITGNSSSPKSPAYSAGSTGALNGFDPGAALAAVAASKGEEDQNKQARKEQFLDSSVSDDSPYLAHVRQAPISPFEVKAGTVIPAVMITGINSDLPGQLSAQVSQNVYNTESGDHLVIPQGSKLVGRYDSQVAFGQKRVLVVWDRLIFPDASSVELAGMPGSDQAGYAGFEDQVDNHYFKIFGSAILMSFISAGAQLSQPDNANGSDSEDASTTLSAALGQQIGQVSAEMTRKNLKIQPTLEIRPGYRFNVMVNKDIAFQQPYN